MFGIQNRVAVVTGGASGIGTNTAETLARYGALVVIADLREMDGRRLADEIIDRGNHARFIRHDVTSENSWRDLMDVVSTNYNRLDILVNNAGIFRECRTEEASGEDLELVCNVNLRGTFLGTQHAVRSMKIRAPDAPYASVINLSSAAGIVGTPFSSIYSMSKGGVRLLTKSAALEFAQLGYRIRCNSIHPAFVNTEMGSIVANGLTRSGKTREDAMHALATLHPLGRTAFPTDIANAVLFLASDLSSFVTGAELVVDGGFTAH